MNKKLVKLIAWGSYSVVMLMVIFSLLKRPTLLEIMIFILSSVLGLFCLAYFVLAPKNIFYTFVKEGTAKAVMRGGKSGRFHKLLVEWKGRDLDSGWNVSEHQNIDAYVEKKRFFGGLRFYGLWPLFQIYKYKFEWTGLKPNGEPLYHEPEFLDYIMLKKDVFYIKVEQAEDKDLLPLNIGVVLTISIVNPYKALFEIQNWLEIVIGRTIPKIRDRITHDNYKELISNTEDISGEIARASKELFREFKENYGVEIHKIEIQNIDPPEEYRKSTLKEFEANQEAKKILILAEAEKARLEKVYGTIDKMGDIGKLIRTLEAIEKSPEKGSKLILAIPGLEKAFKSIGGSLL